MSGWYPKMIGDCVYHVSTVAGGRIVGYVTRNDADEWIAATGDPQGPDAAVVGSGYETLHHAKMAVAR
jgi:hypothetical protein